MNRDEFFRAVLKHFYYEFARTPSLIKWTDNYGVLTITVENISHDCIVRIYSEHYIMISSTNKGPFNIDNFDIEEFKEKYTYLSDNIPF